MISAASPCDFTSILWMKQAFFAHRNEMPVDNFFAVC